MFTWEGIIKGPKDTMWEGWCDVFLKACSKKTKEKYYFSIMFATLFHISNEHGVIKILFIEGRGGTPRAIGWCCVAASQNPYSM